MSPVKVKRIVVSDAARAGMSRCQAYLRERSQPAAARAQIIIREGIKKLKDFPYHGRPYHRSPADLRELVIHFGKGAYLALYRYDQREKTIYIVGFRHGAEEDYKELSY